MASGGRALGRAVYSVKQGDGAGDGMSTAAAVFEMPASAAGGVGVGAAAGPAAPTRAYTITDCPEPLRFWLRWDPGYSRGNMVVQTVSSNLLSGAFVGFPLFTAVTNSVVIGAVMFAVSIAAIFVNLTTKNTHPDALRFYVEHPAAALRIARATKSTAIWSTGVHVVRSSIFWVFIIEPSSRTGALSTIGVPPTTTAVLFWVGLASGSVFNFMNLLFGHVAQEVAKAWKIKITEYFGHVAQELLAVHKGTANVMARLAEEQKSVEAFALRMNRVQAANAGGIALLFTWVVVLMLCLALPSDAKDETTRYIRLGLLGTMACMFFRFLITFLRALTSVNEHWQREKRRFLNDARVQQLVGAHGVYHFDRFDVWLEEHELSALRAFGVRVTLELQRSLASVLITTFVFGLYFILREELRGLLA